MRFPIDRRQFMQASMASLVVGSGAIASSPVVANDMMKKKQFYKVFYDISSVATIDFAKQATLASQNVEGIEDDATDQWFNDLYHYWHTNKQPLPIAGLTTQSVAYCLEVLARDVGLRTVFRATHQLDDDGRYLHAIHNAVSTDQLVFSDKGEHIWSADLYNLVANYSADTQKVIPLDYAPGVSHIKNQDDYLVSWVIASPKKHA